MLGAAPALAKPKPKLMRAEPTKIVVDAKRILDFDPARPGAKTFGELEFLGGLQLNSASEYFGGWSGLEVEKSGKRFITVSDAGVWMTGSLQYEAGSPIAVGNAKIGALKALSGAVLTRGRDRDAESVVLSKGSLTRGSLLIAFEQNHRIGRFAISGNGVSKPASYLRPPKTGRRMSALKGFEAVAEIRGGKNRGAIVAVAERRHDANKDHSGWIWRNGKPKGLTIKDVGGFDITGMAALANGGVILLERRFRWLEGVRMRLRYVSEKDLVSGKTISGKILMAANMAYEIDNMEGLGVHKSARGDTVLTLISDDNFNRGLQRTLLLQFRLRANALSAGR